MEVQFYISNVWFLLFFINAGITFLFAKNLQFIKECKYNLTNILICYLSFAFIGIWWLFSIVSMKKVYTVYLHIPVIIILSFVSILICRIIGLFIRYKTFNTLIPNPRHLLEVGNLDSYEYPTHFLSFRLMSAINIFLSFFCFTFLEKLDKSMYSISYLKAFGYVIPFTYYIQKYTVSILRYVVMLYCTCASIYHLISPLGRIYISGVHVADSNRYTPSVDANGKRIWYDNKRKAFVNQPFDRPTTKVLAPKNIKK